MRLSVVTKARGAFTILSICIVLKTIQTQGANITNIDNFALPKTPYSYRELNPHPDENRPPPSKITFASYNIWNFNDGHNWSERVVSISRIVTQDLNADVVGFNEVRRVLRKEGEAGQDMFYDLSQELKKSGFRYGIYQPGMQYDDIQTEEGVALFSKFPIDESKVRAVHLHMKQDEAIDRNKRVCLYVPLLLQDGTYFHSFVTHFSYSETEQMDNARGVLAFMKDVITPYSAQVRVVLMGDFNVLEGIPSKEKPMDLIKEEGDMVDAWESMHSGVKGNTYCNCKQSVDDKRDCQLNSRLDRVFFFKHQEPLIQNAKLGPHGTIKEPGIDELCPSDHRAISVAINMMVDIVANE